MAGSSGYARIQRMPSTSISAAKTLIQLKAGNAPLDIMAVKVSQTSFTASQMLEIQLSVWSGAYTAATVTAATASTNFDSLNIGDAIGNSLLTLSTTGTGYNASGEPSGGTQHILHHDTWNVLNGSWQYLDIPEARQRVPIGDIWTLKLNTSPSQAGNFIAFVIFLEYL